MALGFEYGEREAGERGGREARERQEAPLALGPPRPPIHQAVLGGGDQVGFPQKALCGGGIPCSFLEPFARSWSHFVGVYRQILTTSLKN